MFAPADANKLSSDTGEIANGDSEMGYPGLNAATKRYHEMAEEFGGTSDELINALSDLARKEARQLLCADRLLRQRGVAEGFHAIADQTYKVACQKKWVNAYALDIRLTIQ